MAIGHISPIWQRARLGMAALAICGMAACSATYNIHGYIPPEEELEVILPGVDTRESLQSSVGQPAATGVIREDAWFYTDYRIRNFAYRAPEIVERNIVAISFDDDGVVQNVERFGLEDGQVVQLSRRVTESSIQEVTVLSQILQSFGRIDVANILGGDN
ncbi:outer membrane protein assembly factor BamE [Roseobacter sp. HKCCD9010]|uniref:outer membrane protein assembly factor BamE n=1 Tax=unclassified Roseobacter TaxID=196798 RepID=UPI001492AD80|nr:MULTISPECIES: outer membrane protein assembly factor BamE [unclassified Roseobacter]MBF9050056.1 outer membrane protein assembly factor BamE [Rhodobacterales bacterium HKCCD4356]NNV12299.1 outer membrane protein assembly factor BamE [Roseobacter sp. HKCCD7357]NNV16238.1 outer membrane protein assembly factor BamE [Roseobacter sp. HKCCD8768]NNV25698.1 outer membrane protein assembly factor BamE [Roseobacter sp. HKCCD8192]NNV29954.1 outer membrane protein assembly factor BamE [Roseobacter sp.